MPIDPMMLNAMLDTFRNMLNDCKQKNFTGEEMDELTKTMGRMEQLGQEHSDMNTFNGAMMQENLFGKFSDYYSRILCNQAKSEYSSGEKGYDDASLLKSSVDALKNAIVYIKKNYDDAIELAKSDKQKVCEQTNAGLDYLERNSEKGKFAATGGLNATKKQAAKEIDNTLKETPAAFDSSVETAVLNDPELIIKGIQDVIDLGEQAGMTLPKFLRLQIETGLDKAMEGSITARKGQEYSLEFTSVNPISPYHIEKEQKKLDKYDELATKQKFNLPNMKELSYAHMEIDREFDNPIAQWQEITERWEDLLWDLSFWSISYCSFAPYIQPWSMAENPIEATIHTQKTTPGLFKQREQLLQKYFGISFIDIFKHPTFLWSVKYNFIDSSQEWIEFLIEKIYPECKPFNDLNSKLIEQRAAFYKKDKNAEDREANPESHLMQERLRDFYDKKFGEGRFRNKFGEVIKSDSKAAPWKIETFKYGK